MNHPINITNGAARQLAVYLNKNGLFDKTGDIFNIGLLLHGSLAEAAGPRKFEGTQDQIQQQFNEWCEKQHHEFTVTESQRDLIKEALKAIAGRKELGVNKETCSLIKEFGLAPE